MSTSRQTNRFPHRVTYMYTLHNSVLRENSENCFVYVNLTICVQQTQEGRPDLAHSRSNKTFTLALDICSYETLFG